MIPAEIGGKIALVVGGMLIGASTSYFFTKRHLTKKYNEMLDSELAHFETEMNEVRDTAIENAQKRLNTQLIQDLGYLDPDIEATNNLIDQVHNFTPERPSTWNEVVDQATITYADGTPVEDVPQEEEDVDSQVPVNAEGGPQILTFDEWFEKDDLGSLSLTYFEGDDVIIDDRQEIVYNAEDILGNEFKTFFGWRTDGDPNVVYIFNPKNDSLYEVNREQSKYEDFIQEEQFVALYDDHRNHIPVRKMRSE